MRKGTKGYLFIIPNTDNFQSRFNFNAKSGRFVITHFPGIIEEKRDTRAKERKEKVYIASEHRTRELSIKYLPPMKRLGRRIFLRKNSTRN